MVLHRIYLYCCLALDRITVAPPLFSGSFSDSNRQLDLTRRGTTARLARYYRLHGTTALRERYYRALCGTKILLPLQPRYYRDLARYYRVWSSTNLLVPHAMAVLPWLTSFACQLSRMSCMGFLCLFVAFALILLACRGCFALCVSGGGSHRSNPSRDTGSKRLRNPGEVPEGSSASKRNVNTSASKHKEPAKGMDEIAQADYVRLRQLHPYVHPRATFRGC